MTPGSGPDANGERPAGVERGPRRSPFASIGVVLAVVGLFLPLGFAFTSIGFMTALLARQQREPRATPALAVTALATVVAVWGPILLGGAAAGAVAA